MRNELKHNLEYAEQIFPKVSYFVTKAADFLHKSYLKKNILEYKEDIFKKTSQDVTKRLEYKTFLNIERKLSKLTGKNMSYYHNTNFWFCAGEVQAFILSVPDPIIITDISKDELTEIITKIWKRGFLENYDMKYSIEKYGYHLINYYKRLLEINFKNYKPEIIDKYDFCFANSINENIEKIVDEIWENS